MTSGRRGQPISRLQRRANACVVLVRVDEDGQGVGPGDLGVRVLRVQHPLPACERIRVVRPLAVIVGRTVRTVDVELLEEVTREVGSELVRIATYVPRSALCDAIRWAVERAARRRAVSVDADLPESRRPGRSAR